MIKIELIPETACLMLKVNNELIDYKFYNKLALDHGDIENAQIEKDIQKMINEYLKEHNIKSLIDTFYNINTKIADNGGAPILKEILKLI